MNLQQIKIVELLRIVTRINGFESGIGAVRVKVGRGCRGRAVQIENCD